MARGLSPARRAAPALLLAALLATGCLSARGTAERPAVRSIRLEGARAVPADEILSRIATRPSGRFFWEEVELFDPDLFAADQRRVEAFYRSRGYYAARVAAAEVKPSGGRVELLLRVEEGEPVRVSEVSVAGLESEPEALAGLGPLPILPGEVFREDRLDEGRAALLLALTSRGWARAEVEQRAEIDPAARTAAVRYTVKPGDRFRFGAVFVSGTSQVPRATVREATAAAIRPGEWYDATQLPRAQARVHDLGVFGGIRVTAGQPDPERGSIPVVVAVREAPFRTVRLGPSLGIEAARWDASLVAGWAHRNWLGGLRKLKLDARLGWSWIRSPFRPDKQGLAGLASADFTQPNVIGQLVDLSARVEGERRIEEGFQFWAERLRLGLPVRLLGRTVAIVPSVNFDTYQTAGDPTTATVGGSSQILLSCPGGAGQRSQSCLLSYLEQRLDLDLRDDPVSTRRGFYLTVSLQEGFRLGTQGFRYLRLLPEARFFLPLGAAVLAARGRVGLLRSYGGDTLPIIARLSSGGPGQERGYQTRKLSPVVALASGGWAAVGGTGLVDGSLEARFPLAGELGGVLFVDAGNVELRAADSWRLDHLQWATGLGLRYRSAFGPIRLDLAARLPERRGGRWLVPTVPVVQVVGGAVVDTGERHTEPVLGFHFSIGEAF
jgi:translocation and assembly module TamA